METKLTKKEYIIQNFQQLKKDISSIISEKEFNKFFSENDIENNLSEYLYYFDYFFKNESNYTRPLRLLRYQSNVQINENEFNEILPIITNYIDNIKKIL
jgi:hypothetical protein